MQWVPGTLSLEVKQLDREADRLSLYSREIKNAWRYTSTPPQAFTAQGQLYLTAVQQDKCQERRRVQQRHSIQRYKRINLLI
jgi:hypothetical protein